METFLGLDHGVLKFDGVGGVEESAERHVVTALDTCLDPVEDTHIVEHFSGLGEIIKGGRKWCRRLISQHQLENRSEVCIGLGPVIMLAQEVIGSLMPAL